VWRTVVHQVLAPLAFRLVGRQVDSFGAMAYPTGEPIVHAPGPAPDRVLVIGGPMVRGIGVATHDLTLSGFLARRLARITGRGADIETRSHDSFVTSTAAETLRNESLERFDAVVILLGIREAVTGRPMRLWRADVARLLATISDTVPASVPVLIVGVPPFARSLGLPAFTERWFDSRVRMINAETQRMCEANSAVDFVVFESSMSDVRYGQDAAAAYDSWAECIAPSLAVTLESSFPGAQLVHLDEVRRQHYVDAFAELHDPHLDHLVEMARDMLGSETASINIIDGDRQWSFATSGRPMDEVPRVHAICNTTITSPGAYIVPDLLEDPVLKSSMWTDEVRQVRFYAGYPIEAPGGLRVGALCVMDRTPRHFSAQQVSTLRDLALRVQSLVWEKRSWAV
jgi:GAF domain